MRPFVLMTGMHRSGTSFLSRALNLAGVHLGSLESLTSNEWRFQDDVSFSYVFILANLVRVDNVIVYWTKPQNLAIVG